MRGYWDTNRTEAFSDAVLAIAITLLVLEIHVPSEDFDHLARAIIDQWPSYLGYATSFLTIGWIWLAHHSMFRRLLYANSAVMRLNLLLLMAVAFLPYPTRLVAETFENTDASRIAVIFYGLMLLTISLLFNALWGCVVVDRTLLKPEVSEEEVTLLHHTSSPNIALFGLAAGLAILAPRVAAILYLAIAALAVLRVRGEPTAEAAEE